MRLPDSCRTRMEQVFFEAFLQTGRCIKSGLDALAMLEDRGIRCAAFKGLASIAYLYPEPGHRSLGDVDILVHPRDAKIAAEVLLANGYKLSIEGRVEDYVDFVKRSPGSAGNEAITMINEKGGGIDLHWRLGRVDTAVLLAKAQRMNVLNRAAPVTSPQHSCLLTVQHALRNNLVVDKVVRDLIDFDTWRPRFNSHSESLELLQSANGWGLTLPLLAMEKIVCSARGVSDSWLAPHASAPDLRKADDLVELYFHQVRFGALNSDLVYLTDAHPLLQVATAAFAGWTRFRKVMKRMDEAKGVPDTLSGRLRRLIAAVRHLPVRRWRQVRTMAMAKQRLMS